MTLAYDDSITDARYTLIIHVLYMSYTGVIHELSTGPQTGLNGRTTNASFFGLGRDLICARTSYNPHTSFCTIPVHYDIGMTDGGRGTGPNRAGNEADLDQARHNSTVNIGTIRDISISALLSFIEGILSKSANCPL